MPGRVPAGLTDAPPNIINMQLIELIFELVVQGVLYKTGRKVLARFGLKSNLFVETLLGIIVLSAGFYALVVFGVFVILLVKQFH